MAPPENGTAVYPHGHFPRRSRRQLRRRRRRAVVRSLGVGVLALPVGILATASPLAQAYRTPLPALVAPTPAPAARVTHQLQVKHKTVSEHAALAVASALSRCRASLSDEQRWRIADAVERESRRHGWDPLFAQALIEVESTCQPTARSSRGALGLTQVQPATARAMADDAGVTWRGASTLLDPELNVRIGLFYLSQLEERFGDIHVAVAAYNLGPDRVEGMSRDWARRSRYVRKILARYEDLLADTKAAAS